MPEHSIFPPPDFPLDVLEVIEVAITQAEREGATYYRALLDGRALISDETTIAGLMDALDAPMSCVKVAAAFLLGVIGKGRAEGELLILCDDADYCVRAVAVWALGGCHSHCVITRLREIACGDENSTVKVYAAHSLASAQARRALQSTRIHPP